MATGNDLIRLALTEIGVIPVGEAIPTAWTSLALSKLNAFLQNWAVEGLLLPVLTSNTVTLTIGQSSYTIGASGNFNVRRPVEVVSGTLTSAGVVYPLSIRNTRDRYDSHATIPSGRPTDVDYDPTLTLGTLLFSPNPDAAYSVTLRSLVSTVPLSASTDTVVAPPEYDAAFYLALAVDLMAPFGKSDTVVMAKASAAKAALITNNSKRLAVRAYMDAALLIQGGARTTGYPTILTGS